MGLPAFVRDKLHRRDIDTQNKLIIEINQLESLVTPHPIKPTPKNSNWNTTDNKSSIWTNPNKFSPFKEQKFCPICENAGYPGRRHSELSCHYNPKNKKNNRNAENNPNNIKISNNTELEESLNSETNQKKLSLPPLITLKVKIEDFDATGLYDPGANISMVSATYLAKLDKKITNKNKYIFRTMSGEAKQKGIIFLKLKIFEIEKTMRFFVIEKKNFKYDLLLGLDCIKEFRLCQDHNLTITQFAGSPQGAFPNINMEIEVNWKEAIPFEKFEAKISHLDNNKQAEIERLLEKYESLFARHRYNISEVKNHEALIELLENK